MHPPLPVLLLPRRIAIGRFGGTDVDVAVVVGLVVPRRAVTGMRTAGRSVGSCGGTVVDVAVAVAAAAGASSPS